MTRSEYNLLVKNHARWTAFIEKAKNKPAVANEANLKMRRAQVEIWGYQIETAKVDGKPVSPPGSMTASDKARTGEKASV